MSWLMCSLTTHRCICTAVVTTLCRQLFILNAGSLTSVNGCPLITSSSTQTRSSCCGWDRVLQLSPDSITARDHVCLLGAMTLSDLNLDQHISVVSASCFNWLWQLHTRRSLDQEAAATLVHAFITSHVNYCNTQLTDAPKVMSDKLQKVLNAAARILTTIQFNQGLSQLLHTKLDIPEQVIKSRSAASTVKRHTIRQITVYGLWCASRQQLCSTSRHLLVVPDHCLSMYGRRAFAVAQPTVWNSLSQTICGIQMLL